MHKVFAVCIACVLSIVLTCCGVIDGEGEHERVTSITITPRNPSAGDIVTVKAEWDSSYSYLPEPGSGPYFKWNASSGEMTGYAINADNIELGPTTVRGLEFRITSSTVQWKLPDEPGEVWIRAEMSTGGKTLRFTLE